jgi:Molybdopterin-binding domain of aldehyde dehydrogenase
MSLGLLDLAGLQWRHRPDRVLRLLLDPRHGAAVARRFVRLPAPMERGACAHWERTTRHAPVARRLPGGVRPAPLVRPGSARDRARAAARARPRRRWLVRQKAAAYPEYVAILHAARALGRPVKWCDERADSFLLDQQGRGTVVDAELALDQAGNFLAASLATPFRMAVLPASDTVQRWQPRCRRQASGHCAPVSIHAAISSPKVA